MSIDKNIKNVREAYDFREKIGGSRVLYKIDTERFINSIMNRIGLNFVRKSKDAKLINFSNHEEYKRKYLGVSITGDAVSYKDKRKLVAPYEKNELYKDEKEVRLVLQLYEETYGLKNEKIIVRVLSSDKPINIYFDPTNCFRKIE